MLMPKLFGESLFDDFMMDPFRDFERMDRKLYGKHADRLMKTDVFMAAMILAEVGDFSNFDSPDKVLAYAGMSPSTYQSSQLTSTYARMEKRGSRYLRYAFYNITKYVCRWDANFSAYLAKKRAEGKHYNVALSHAAKRLVRLLYALQLSGKQYQPAV